MSTDLNQCHHYFEILQFTLNLKRTCKAPMTALYLFKFAPVRSTDL